MKKCISAVISILMIAVMTVSSSAYVMSNRYMTVYYGGSVNLYLDKSLTPEDVTFTSLNPKIASVDENGAVKSNGVGTCVITCTNNETGETDKCEVHVELLWWKVIENILYFFRNMMR